MIPIIFLQNVTSDVFDFVQWLHILATESASSVRKDVATACSPFQTSLSRVVIRIRAPPGKHQIYQYMQLET
jgi:hypothetical protein